MARYTGPRTKIARKFGEAIFGPDKVLTKKNYPPGQHGINKRRKTSEYGVQLREKQKAKYTYGVLERQFRNLFEKASRTKGVKGEVLLQLLGSSSRQCRISLGYSTHTCSCPSARFTSSYRSRWQSGEYPVVFGKTGTSSRRSRESQIFGGNSRCTCWI